MSLLPQPILEGYASSLLVNIAIGLTVLKMMALRLISAGVTQPSDLVFGAQRKRNATSLR